MSKPYPIRWTKEADTTYFTTIAFIFEKWTIKEVLHFEALTDQLLFNLSSNHKLCPELNKLNLRKCVISEQTSLVYRVISKKIELIAFVDNRSNHLY